MKKIACVLLLLCVLLSGCEGQDLRAAEEKIDDIESCYDRLVKVKDYYLMGILDEEEYNSRIIISNKLIEIRKKQLRELIPKLNPQNQEFILNKINERLGMDFDLYDDNAYFDPMQSEEKAP